MENIKHVFKKNKVSIPVIHRAPEHENEAFKEAQTENEKTKIDVLKDYIKSNKPEFLVISNSDFNQSDKLELVKFLRLEKSVKHLAFNDCKIGRNLIDNLNTLLQKRKECNYLLSNKC